MNFGGHVETHTPARTAVSVGAGRRPGRRGAAPATTWSPATRTASSTRRRSLAGLRTGVLPDLQHLRRRRLCRGGARTDLRREHSFGAHLEDSTPQGMEVAAAAAVLLRRRVRIKRRLSSTIDAQGLSRRPNLPERIISPVSNDTPPGHQAFPRASMRNSSSTGMRLDGEEAWAITASSCPHPPHPAARSARGVAGVLAERLSAAPHGRIIYRDR